jgi:hypothetical protein
MKHKQLLRTLLVCVSSVVALPLAGCDGGGGGNGGGNTGSSAHTTSSGSGTSNALTCASNYCMFGMGGYAFGYSDSQNMSPQVPGTSTATLATDMSLCISGNVMALPPNPTQMDYSNDWGCGIGINVNQMMGMNMPKGVFKSTLTGVTVDVSNMPTCTQARVVLDDMMGGTQYCAAITPGKEIPWATFNTECWNGMGMSLTGAPSTQAVKVQFVTSSAACMFSNFCITELKI